jgi:membrane fusion protein, multidrug efflux system
MSSTDQIKATADGDEKRLRRLRAAGIVAILLAVALYSEGVISRVHADRQLKAWTDMTATPSVRVLFPQPAETGAAFSLPGRLAADENAPIHARVSGYVKAWYVDIGAHVKRGQVLAVIDTPEIDQQRLQARADLARQRADRDLAASTAKRWAEMLKQDSVSRQAADEKAGEFAVRQADVEAGEANVRRLEALETFKTLVAPFDGTVTDRHADIGQLVNAGDDAGNALYTVAAVSRLRLYVRFPQDYAGRILPGARVAFVVPEQPGRTFGAAVVSTNQAVDARSGTLLAQLDVDNRAGRLIPGEYAEVKFDLRPTPGSLLVPASAMIFRGESVQLAVVDAGNRVKLRDVRIGTDLGTQLEIDGGIGSTDRVIDNPPDSIVDGERVRIVQAHAGAPGAASGSAGANT